jgi:hypothetical protein
MRHSILSLALLAMMTAFGASKAHAVFLTYSYTGNNFTYPYNYDDDFYYPFSPGDRITGSFTVDCGSIGQSHCSSLPYADYKSAVTSFSFSAGGFMIDETTPLDDGAPDYSFGKIFFFSTEPNAEIIHWYISLVPKRTKDWWWTFSPDPMGPSTQIGYPIDSVGVPTSCRAYCPTPYYEFARITGSPGQWSAPTVRVTEPSTLSNVLVSLAALLLLLWRRRALPVRAYGRPLAPQLEP